MDAFESREWHTAERVIVEIKDLLSKQVRLNPPDAVALNPFIEQAESDLAEARRNLKSPAPAPVPPPAQTSPARASLPGPERKAAKHDWGAAGRAREKPVGSDDDDDDFCVVNPRGADVPKNLGGPQRAVTRRPGREPRGSRTAEAHFESASANAAENADPPPRRAGFVSAGHRLDAENAKKGVAPGRRDSRGGGPVPDERSGNAIARNGFVPPYVRKAFAGSDTKNAPSNGVRGETAAKRQKAGGVSNRAAPSARSEPTGDAEGEPPFCEATMRRLSPNGEPIPETLLKMDRDIVDRVVAEILETPATVSWENIAGLEHAKAAVQELAVWPLMKPELFRGARAVPRGLLLFGPPGTGKTLIGRAVASQCGATFFSISASSLTSKWIGEGEKMVRALFAVAAACEPAVIFVDEIDSLLSARKSDGEHESSRRMKTEFLVQMDGLGGDEGRMLLIGATNRPQELDDGARRRLAKQLYIPLPCAKARRAMVTNILSSDASVAHALSDSDLNVICAKTEGYSGSDMKHLTQEAARAPLRELFSSRAATGGFSSSSGAGGDGIPSPSAMRPIKLADFKRASKQVRPSVTQADIEFHEQWNREHGAMSGGADGAEEEDDDEW
jgi:SpoVK/Ycf46/Vps4 family AAA+-type ATPase